MAPTATKTRTRAKKPVTKKPVKPEVPAKVAKQIQTAYGKCFGYEKQADTISRSMSPAYWDLWAASKELYEELKSKGCWNEWLAANKYSKTTFKRARRIYTANKTRKSVENVPLSEAMFGRKTEIKKRGGARKSPKGPTWVTPVVEFVAAAPAPTEVERTSVMDLVARLGGWSHLMNAVVKCYSLSGTPELKPIDTE